MSATHALSLQDEFTSSPAAAGASLGRNGNVKASNALSPSASSGPKPLHLPLASVVTSSRSSSTPDLNASYPSPGPSSSLNTADAGGEGQNASHSSQSSGPDSKAGVGEGGSSKSQPLRPNPISLNSPNGSSSFTHSTDPSYPSPLSPSISGLKKQNPRRQSSISYITSSSPSSRSPSTPQFQFNSKRASTNGDLASPAHLRSPLSSVHPTFGEALEDTEGWQSNLGLGGGLARSNSLGGRASRGSRSPRSPIVGEKERSSTGSIVPPQNMKHLKERPPVTLAEKHAELLHFIAQKESKCLELRSQLAVHEAELLQLKRKWERIVNRGFEKPLSPSSPPSLYNYPHPTSPPTSSIPLSASLLSTSPDSTFSPTATPNTPSTQGAGAAVVLEGIKEGVQGVSRFIAAGLESIVHVGPPSAGQSASEKADAPSTQHAPPLPLKLGSVTSGGGSVPAMARNKRHSYLGHEQKASQSSSSSSSTRTSATSSSLVSAGSSSATSSASRMSTDSASGASTTRGNTEGTTVPDAPAASEAEDDFGAFESAQPQSSHSSPNSSADDEQVLMVYDSGATPTMSPNPAFEKRRSRMDRKRVEVEKLVFSQGGSQVGKERTAEGEDFGWDYDVWGDHDQAQPPSSSSPSMKAPPIGTSKSSSSSTTASASQRKPISSRNARPKSPLAPMSSIPGLSMGMNMGNMSAPSAEQVSSWMGSMGKKWGEITKGGSTLVKNPKRASLLLSDMQQSIVSALGSPISISGAPQTPASARSPPSSYAPPLSSNASQTSSRTSTSLIDDSDDESFGESGLSMAKSPVLVPESLSAKSSALKTAQAANRLSMSKAGAAEKKKDEDEDEWNW